jgi:hypothetical protein
MSQLIFSLLTFLLFNSSSIFAIETEAIRSEEIIIKYDSSLIKVAREVKRIYPSVRQDIEKTFKWKIDFRPSIVLIKDRKTFQKMVVSAPVVAVAIPEKNLIIIDNSKMKTHPFTMEATLKHELCHLMLHHYIQKGNLPRWLNEGVSQWASGGMAEIMIGENKDLLKQSTLSGRFIRLEDLTHIFPADPTSLLLAYQESKSIVEYIISEHGNSGILQILNKLREGRNINDSIQNVLSVSRYELESNWHSHLRTKYTWFTYLSNHLYQVLFFIAALAMVYGFIKFLIRKKNYRDEEEYLDD